MNAILEIILCVSSVIGALTTITVTYKNVKHNSKKGIDEYILKQVKPQFDTLQQSFRDGISVIENDIRDLKECNDRNEMQRLRYECLCFASDIRKGEAKTRQEYEEVFRMEDAYERLTKQYNVRNGYMLEEMSYVHKQYQSLLNIH